MISLREGVTEYLELRRSLGFRLKKDELYLGDFAGFIERRHATHITAKLAVKWARQPASTDANYHAGRLRAVRSFARYRILSDPRTEIPATDLLPRREIGLPAPHLQRGGDKAHSGGKSATVGRSDPVLLPGALHDLWPDQRHRDARR